MRVKTLYSVHFPKSCDSIIIGLGKMWSSVPILLPRFHNPYRESVGRWVRLFDFCVGQY